MGNTAMLLGNIKDHLPQQMIDGMIGTANVVNSECVESGLDGFVENIYPNNRLPSFYNTFGKIGYFATAWIGPHTDKVSGTHTIGIVFQSDHYLFTGNNRKAFDLACGDVYLLDFAKQHGASRSRNSDSKDLLVFAAHDFSAATWKDAIIKGQRYLEKLVSELVLANTR